VDAFTTDALAERCAERGLVFDRRLLGQLVTALRIGKHVALTGPPGTGKTTLAYLVADLARHSLLCTGSVGVTASREWDTSVTIGRYVNTREGPTFEPGVFVDAIETGHWLVIDELNRADFDQAFGPFFTVLAGQPVTLPFKRTGHELPIAIVPQDAEAGNDVDVLRVPGPWRIIATLNVFDKELLYRLSHALMRRFAFIEVPAPSDEVIESLLPPEARLVSTLLVLQDFVDLGPAVFLDAGRFAAERLLDPSVTPSRVLYEVFSSYFAPQLDGLSAEDASRLTDRLLPYFDGEDRDEVARLIRVVVLGRTDRVWHVADAFEPAGAPLRLPPALRAVHGN
jgi:hypothetical protein